jgi:hypothetical protein
MRFIFLFLLFSLQAFSSPEEKIIVIENFITKNTAKKIRAFYETHKKNLIKSEDNQLSIQAIKNKEMQEVIIEISNKVLDLIPTYYPYEKKKMYLDHGGLYARITGNFCPYHADNCYFSCPIHGDNQSYLRTHCDGTCKGSIFKPNHTSWREYTALIYLNDDFEGGEILFEDGPHNKVYQKVISIQEGMLILAPNGSDFYHEVFPIKKGMRYSIHLWFTSDRNHRF